MLTEELSEEPPAEGAVAGWGGGVESEESEGVLSVLDSTEAESAPLDSAEVESAALDPAAVESLDSAEVDSAPLALSESEEADSEDAPKNCSICSGWAIRAGTQLLVSAVIKCPVKGADASFWTGAAGAGSAAKMVAHRVDNKTNTTIAFIVHRWPMCGAV